MPEPVVEEAWAGQLSPKAYERLLRLIFEGISRDSSQDGQSEGRLA